MDTALSTQFATRSAVILDAPDPAEHRRLLHQLKVSGISYRLIAVSQMIDACQSSTLDPIEFLKDFETRLLHLTQDETRVLECILEGITNKAMSRRLDSSVRTIDFRKASLMKKLGVKSTTQLIRKSTMFDVLKRHYLSVPDGRQTLPAEVDGKPPHRWPVPR